MARVAFKVYWLLDWLDHAPVAAAPLLLASLFSGRPRTAVAPVDRRDDDPAVRLQKLEDERRELSRLSRLTLEFVHRVHRVERLRDIPPNVLDYLVRLFAPREALVLIRRRPAVADTQREHQLIVAATTGRIVRRGTVLTIGRGPLGQVASRGLVVERPPSPETADELRGFRPDLAVPISSGDDTFGVLTVSGSRPRPRLALQLTQFVAAAAAHTYQTSADLYRMRSRADIDTLTGILNKGAIGHRLEECTAEALESGRPLSLFLFDIDHFKNYNDTNGHPAGDDCLRLVSRLVAERVRADDAFGRWGGEEFLLLLPGREPSDALIVAEEIRRRIADFAFPHGDKQPLGCISVSGGIACVPDYARDADSVVEAADRALYAAKRGGRNRIEIARTPAPQRPSPTLPDLPPQEDDLQEIRGIDRDLAAGMRGLGIFSFLQIAELDWQGMLRLASALGTNAERMVREQWLAQARDLHRERHGGET